MGAEDKKPNKSSSKDSTGSRAGGFRLKTGLRLQYEAEVALIKKEIGSLEEIRGKLGFSRRKICQLLLVDPSSWTRWVRDESKVPPHVFRALSWYLNVSRTPARDQNFSYQPVERPVEKNGPFELAFIWKLLIILNLGFIIFLVFKVIAL